MLQTARNIILAVIDFFHWPFKRLIGLQTFRYLACGGTNAVLNIGIFYLVLHFVLRDRTIFIGHLLVITPYIMSFIIAFVISFPIGFVLSKYIVFPESNLRGRVQIFRYALLVGFCVLLNYLFIKLFVEWCHFYPTFSYVLTNILVAVFSYISQRTFTFKVKKDSVNTELPL